MKILLAVLMVLTMASSSSAQQAQSPADVIFINGNIYLGAPSIRISTWSSSSGQPKPEPFKPIPGPVHAIAVSAGKITAVGSNEEIQKLKGPKTQVIDLGGHFVMPGFNDAHVHLGSGGFEKLNVNLIGSKSLDDMKQRIAARAKTAAPGEWIIGRGWDHTLWGDQKMPGQKTPTKADIDSVTGDHPAIFNRVDGHIAIANSAALKAAGITAQSPDPHGGKIDKDDKGEPTGILRETAMSAVAEKIPPPTMAQRRSAAELALADAAQWGITSAQDNSDWEDFLTYEQMEKEGKLTLRIAEWLPFDAPVEQLLQKRQHHAQEDPMIHTTMLKGFMDGSLGSRTAAMLAPYSDDPKNSGIPRYEQDKLNAMAAERVGNNFQLGFHAIGDSAARMALDAFAYAEQKTGNKNLRFRIEHDQVIAPEDFKKYKDLGVIASVQPNHLLTDMNWAESHIGPARAKHSYPWKEFEDNGVVLAFGTDYPVEPITPFRGLYAAVTRKNEAGNKEYYPQQKLTIGHAIYAYTMGAAYAEFAEEKKGMLVPGMLADLVVLDRDITKVPPADILHTRVLRTVVGGKTVYESK